MSHHTSLVLAWLLATHALAAGGQPLFDRVQTLAWASSSVWQPALHDREAASTWRIELRPDVDLEQGAWHLHVRPRLLWQRAGSDAWLNELRVGWQGETLGLYGGRETLVWGPSLFRLVSNPLWQDTGRNEPQQEIAGHDLLRMELTLDRAVRLQAVHQMSEGHDTSDPRRAEQVNLLRLQLATTATLVDAVVSRRAGCSTRIGLAGQWTAGDALLVYADSSWGRREGTAPGLLPLDRGRRLDGLVGAAWTFESGHVVHAELFWHGSGLSPGEYDAWQTLWQATPAAARPALFDPGVGLLGRRHVALQWMNDNSRALGWVLRLQHALDDDSGEVVALLKQDIGSRWQVWANALGHYGPSDGDWNRALRYRAQAGVTLYF